MGSGEHLRSDDKHESTAKSRHKKAPKTAEHPLKDYSIAVCRSVFLLPPQPITSLVLERADVTMKNCMKAMERKQWRGKRTIELSACTGSQAPGTHPVRRRRKATVQFAVSPSSGAVPTP